MRIKEEFRSKGGLVCELNEQQVTDLTEKNLKLQYRIDA